MSAATGQSIGAPLTERERLERWTLQLSREAFAADEPAATEAVQMLTGGRDSFCPAAFASEQLHRAAACFLRIARLQS